jgi:hypothetical protein
MSKFLYFQKNSMQKQTSKRSDYETSGTINGIFETFSYFRYFVVCILYCSLTLNSTDLIHKISLYTIYAVVVLVHLVFDYSWNWSNAFGIAQSTSIIHYRVLFTSKFHHCLYFLKIYICWSCPLFHTVAGNVFLFWICSLKRNEVKRKIIYQRKTFEAVILFG